MMIQTGGVNPTTGQIDPAFIVEGDNTGVGFPNAISTAGVIKTGHAFLDDIAHNDCSHSAGS